MLCIKAIKVLKIYKYMQSTYTPHESNTYADLKIIAYKAYNIKTYILKQNIHQSITYKISEQKLESGM